LRADPFLLRKNSLSLQRKEYIGGSCFKTLKEVDHGRNAERYPEDD
jgi:hypothetical protein